MPKDSERKNSIERTRIDISQNFELEYWCHELSAIMTPDKLINLVNRVGPDIEDVKREWLCDLGDESERIQSIGEIIRIKEGRKQFIEFVLSQRDLKEQ